MSKTQKITSIGFPIFFILAVAGLCIFVVGMRNAIAVSAIDDEFHWNSHEANQEGALTAPASNNDDTPPILVEMFLSQSCSSCVPAARYVTDLSERKDVVVLSWHVDYWDDLVVFRHGKWKDPYSSRDYTSRQRNYRLNIPTGRIYTPQAVVHGSFEDVGSRTSAIEPLISRAKNVAAKSDPRSKLNLTHENDQLTVSLNGIPSNGGKHEANLVFFHRNTQTSILGGENAGHDWRETNVVKGLRPFGIDGKQFKTSLSADEIDADTGCAIIVQERRLGRVVAASYCPIL